MPAKKKPAKKQRRPNDRARNAEAMVEQLAGDLQRLLAERDDARKELAEARRGRETWCHTAVNLELRAERAEEQLRVLLAGITAPRPSAPATVEELGLKGLRAPEPGPTLGLPGDAPMRGRFSREFRG